MFRSSVLTLALLATMVIMAESTPIATVVDPSVYVSPNEGGLYISGGASPVGEDEYVFSDDIERAAEAQAFASLNKPVADDVSHTLDPDTDPDPIQSRQTSAREIIQRASRRTTAPRAYASTTPCGGFAGQTVLLQIGSTFVGPLQGGTNRLNTNSAQTAATAFTLDSVCQLVDATGRILNTHGTGAAPNFVYLDPLSTISANVGYSPLTCRGDVTNTLTCTRFTPATAGSFCSNGANAFGYGNSCIGATTVVPVLVNAPV
ncbi:hypothetical protein IAU60_003389 [Kwoniella sp. DSM 27419]